VAAAERAGALGGVVAVAAGDPRGAGVSPRRSAGAPNIPRLTATLSVAPATRHPVGLPVHSSVVDRAVAAAVARSFLAKLPPALVDELMADGARSDYPAGTGVYRAGAPARAQLVIEGLLRVYLSSAEGRQVTVRYARDGDVLGIAVIVGGPVDVGVQTVVPSSLFSINPRRLTRAARQDARVAWAVAEELAVRLDDTLHHCAGPVPPSAALPRCPRAERRLVTMVTPRRY
jgi:Cyclic nucleotide-binding domain